MPSDWYVARSGKKAGPYTAAILRKLANEGLLSPDDLIWKEGISDWIPASRIEKLFPKPSNQQTQASSADRSTDALVGELRRKQRVESGMDRHGRTKAHVRLGEVALRRHGDADARMVARNDAHPGFGEQRLAPEVGAQVGQEADGHVELAVGHRLLGLAHG